jgi:hypothetical protein
MKNYSLLIKLVICCALVVCSTFGLMHNPSYGQGRTLTAEQIEAIVKPSLAQCAPPSGESSSIDPASVIPTSNAREFPKARIARTLHGMWRGEVYGDYNKDLRVDYFWIIDTQRNEGLIIAQRTGNATLGGMRPVPNAPKITYLMCANEGYTPSSEGGSQIHEFTKVSNSIEEAQEVLERATGLDLQAQPHTAQRQAPVQRAQRKGQRQARGQQAPRRTQRQAQGQRVANPVRQQTQRPTLTDLWQEIVASGYFKSLPAVAFAGALFKPIQLDLVPSTMGPALVSMKWNSEYYGGGATQLKFTPGVPMRGIEYTQFVGTTATSGDFLVASPGNGNLYKVEASTEEAALYAQYSEYYDLAFDSVTFGPLQE